MIRDAYSYIVPLGLLSGLCLLLGWWITPGFYLAAIILLLLTLFVAFFFRDPERQAPTDERLIVSPADGLVVVVKPIGPAGPNEPDNHDNGGTQISIFLSIFDVHVNRSPLAGKILNTEYRPGRFLIATKQKASIENEQNVVTVENQYARVIFKQIAGLIARRIVFWKAEGEQVKLGERVGLIKFGSRVDVLLPPQVKVQVKRGDRVKGGISIIGKVDI